MSNSTNFKAFELTEESAENIKLTASGFKRKGETVQYLCKITDAYILYVGDDSDFPCVDRKKLSNIFTFVLPDDQSEILKRIIDRTQKKNLPYRDINGEIEFKVKLDPKTKFDDEKANEIDLKKVPCVDEELSHYLHAARSIMITGESKEFKTETGQKFSYATLSAVQIQRDNSDFL